MTVQGFMPTLRRSLQYAGLVLAEPLAPAVPAAAAAARRPHGAVAGAEWEPQPLLSFKCKRAGRHLDEGRAGSRSCQRCSQAAARPATNTNELETFLSPSILPVSATPAAKSEQGRCARVPGTILCLAMYCTIGRLLGSLRGHGHDLCSHDKTFFESRCPKHTRCAM